MIREAVFPDITQIQVLRNRVRENRLSDPSLVSDNDVAEYLFNRGKGWVCERGNQIAGFSIVSLRDNNVWALFIDPLFEKLGIGRQLHDIMLDWYFNQTSAQVWLSTAARTRAEQFYRKAGWIESGSYGKSEIKFVMDIDTWKNNHGLPR